MTAYLIRRLLLMIPTLIGVITITFFISEFVPGGPLDQVQAVIEGRTAVGAGAEVSAMTSTGTHDPRSGKRRRVDPKQEMRLRRFYGYNHSRLERYLRTLLWFSPDSLISSREIDPHASEKVISRETEYLMIRRDDRYFAYENHIETVPPGEAEPVSSEIVYDSEPERLRSVIDGQRFDLETGRALTGTGTLTRLPLRTEQVVSHHRLRKEPNELKRSVLEMRIREALAGETDGARIRQEADGARVRFEENGRTITALDRGDHFEVTEQWTEVYRRERLREALLNSENWHGFFLFRFGRSIKYNKTVFELIRERLPVSIRLGVISFFLTYLVCITLGIAKAVRTGSRFDTLTSVLVLVGNSIPGFVLGVLLLSLFGPGESALLHLFPLGGLHSSPEELAGMSGFRVFLDHLHHLAAPVLCFCIGSFAVTTFLTKNSILEQIHQLYAVAARARGLSERKVLFKHILRNSLIPLITGFPAGFLMMFFTGSMLIEKIFNLNGLGLLSYSAVMDRDFPVIMSSLFVFTILGLVARLLTDICYVVVDPRISFEGKPR